MTNDDETFVREKMPLVTVVRLNRLKPLITEDDARWGTFRLEVGKADAVERRCKMPGCRYYYAGRAGEGYGDLAFAYGPEAEVGQRGDANPFDSGGLYFGGFYPFKEDSPEDEEERKGRACVFIKETQIKLSEWRGEFARYLATCYATNGVQSYLNGDPPRDRDQPLWGDKRLPVWHKDNLEWGAWTWEIRLQAQPPLEQGLQAWSASETDYISLINDINAFCEKTDISRAKALKEMAGDSKFKEIQYDGQDACEVINDWIMRQLKL